MLLNSPLSTVSPRIVRWNEMEVKPHQPAIIIKRSISELESMKEFNHLQQHIISLTRFIQIVLSNVPTVSIDMFLCHYLYVNFIYKTIWTSFSVKYFKHFCISCWCNFSEQTFLLGYKVKFKFFPCMNYETFQN